MTSPEQTDLLRVAFPSARNTQQTTEIDRIGATRSATTAQQTSLKALASLALERNKPRNSDATGGLKVTQQTTDFETDFVARDFVACVALPIGRNNATKSPTELLLAEMERETADRERGRCPRAETSRALCRSCGPVWLAPEVTACAPVIEGWPVVLGCPWCHVKNRRAIPRPEVKCGECAFFDRDRINPVAGMGRCKAGKDPDRAYPDARRECDAWRSA